MTSLICRFCGYPVTPLGQTLKSTLGEICAGNPAGHHAAIPDGTHCIWCGNPSSSQSGKLRTTHGFSCPHSPTGMHCLA